MPGWAGRLVFALVPAFGASGCFVDAIGEATTGGDATTPTGTSSAASSGTGSSSVSSSASASSGGAGGSAGAGGAGCSDRVLDFDESDSARLSTGEANIGDDFAVGAWVFPRSGPSFAPGDGTNYFEWIIDHADFTDDDGYLIGIGEPNDAGMPWASFVAFPNGVECAANSLIEFDQWIHIAGRYRDDVGGDDLFLLVNDVIVASANCGDAPPIDDYRGPVVLGRREETGGQHFLGMLDDVFLKSGGNVDPFAPLACDMTFIFAFDFEDGLESICSGPPLALALDMPPDDPEPICGD